MTHKVVACLAPLSARTLRKKSTKGSVLKTNRPLHYYEKMAIIRGGGGVPFKREGAKLHSS